MIEYERIVSDTELPDTAPVLRVHRYAVLRDVELTGDLILRLDPQSIVSGCIFNGRVRVEAAIGGGWVFTSNIIREAT